MLLVPVPDQDLTLDDAVAGVRELVEDTRYPLPSGWRWSFAVERTSTAPGHATVSVIVRPVKATDVG